MTLPPGTYSVKEFKQVRDYKYLIALENDLIILVKQREYYFTVVGIKEIVVALDENGKSVIRGSDSSYNIHIFDYAVLVEPEDYVEELL